MPFFKPKINNASSERTSSSSNTSFFGVQPKLRTGEANDNYEQEADAVADKVVRKRGLFGAEPFFAPAPKYVIQRLEARENELQQKQQTEQIQEKPVGESITPLVQWKESEEEPVQMKEEETPDSSSEGSRMGTGSNQVEPVQMTQKEESVQKKVDENIVQKSPNDNGGGYWAFSTKHLPEMDSMSEEETAAYCYSKITGLSEADILQRIQDGRIVLYGIWSAKNNSKEGYFNFSISKSLYAELTGYVSTGGDESTSEEQAELSDVPLFNSGSLDGEESKGQENGSGLGTGNGTGKGTGSGTGQGQGSGTSASRFEERGKDDRRVGASDRDDFFETLPKEEQVKINQEADRIFRELNDWEEDRLIQPGDPQQYKDFWKEIRDNLLIDKQRMEQLPEHVKNILTSNGRKISPEQYTEAKVLLQHLVQLDDTQLETLDRLLNSGDTLLNPTTELNVNELIALSKLMKDFTPNDFMEYMSQTNAQTMDLREFRQAIERFLERKKEKQAEAENLENIKTKLFGLEGLYAAYKAFVTKVGINEAMKTIPGDKFERQIMRNDLHRSGLDDTGIDAERAKLTLQMQANGFESIQEFEQYLRDYEKAFEQSTVRLAEDHLLRYRHLLYEEEKKLNDDAYLTQLLQEVKGSGAKGHYEAAFQAGDDAGTISYEEDRYISSMMQEKSRLQQKASSERGEGKAAIEGNVSSFLVKEDQFDHEELAFTESKAKLKEQLQAYIQEKYESINETWADLHENSEYVYKLDKLFAANIEAQGIEEGSIYDSIINDKAKRIADAEWFKTITVIILAIVLTIVTLGAAAPFALAAGVSSVGLSMYSVYEAAETYKQNNAANDVGLLTDDPSLVWVVLAIAGAAFDVGALASVFKAAKPIADATKAVRTVEDLAVLEVKLEQIGELTAKMRSNIMKSAEAQVQADKMIKSVLTPQAGMAKMVIVPYGEEFARLVAAAYYMAKKGAIDFQSFLLKLKAEKLIDDIGALTAEEKLILKDAFGKGKSFSEDSEVFSFLGKTVSRKNLSNFFTPEEFKVVQEVELLLNSKEIEILETAASKGKHVTVSFNGRTITFEPDIPAGRGFYAITDSDSNGFHLGVDAFQNKQELTKTLLHELHRLSFSEVVKTGTVTTEMATISTSNAHEFANKAYILIFEP